MEIANERTLDKPLTNYSVKGDSICPLLWKHARFLVLAKSTLSLGDKNEAKHHPPMATHPSLLAFYYLTQVTTMSETFHHIIIMEIIHRTIIAFD